MGRHKKEALPIKFPVETVWHVFVVRAVDRRGVFRLALSFVTPCGRRTFEFRSIPKHEERIDRFRDAIVEIVSSAPWWERPDVVVLDETALFEEMTRSGTLRGMTLVLETSRSMQQRSVDAFQHYSVENPRFDKPRRIPSFTADG